MGTSDKRSRTKYTTEQLAELERVFCQTQYPDTNTMEELADKLNVTMEKVSIWFQNRRSKFKRQSKDTHMSWMRKQIFNRDSVPHSVPKSDDKKHVLSPPEASYHRQDTTTYEKPSSNLHYLPPLPQYLDSVLDLSVYPPQTSPPCGQPSPPSPYENQQDSLRYHPGFPSRSLLFSHLMAEQQAGSASPQQLYHPSQISSCMYNTSFPGMYYYPSNVNVNQFGNMVSAQSTVM